jgi:hypothetical protein
MMNRIFTAGLLLTLLFLVPKAMAQKKTDCSKVSSAGCTSFNEMIAAGDSDILEAINSKGKAARVCFVEGEDHFTILSYKLSPDGSWRKQKDGIIFQNGPWTATFKRYKEGISDDFFIMRLSWSKIGEDGDLTGEGKGVLGTIAILNIESDEITMTTKWTNKLKTTTTFQLSIRLATGRFKVSRLSWKWSERSSGKITERTHEKRAKAFHRGREGCHPKTAFVGQGAGVRLV